MLGVLFSAGHDWNARVVRTVTRSDWNHAALVDLSAGELVEARTEGVVWRPWTAAELNPAYRETLAVVDGVDADDARRAWAWARHQVGRRYGSLAALSIGLRSLTGLPLAIENLRELTCSELVAVALLIAGRELPAGIVAVAPGDVAEALLGSRRRRDVVTVGGEA